MSPAHCREEARQLLESRRCTAVLPDRAGLLWRTHDGGLTGFQEERLDEGLRAALRRLLGSGRQRAPERAACPVRLLYGLAAGGLRVAATADEVGTLPGNGILLKVGEHLVCLSSAPLACLEALAEAEAGARERVLGRLLDGPGSTSSLAADNAAAVPESAGHGSCGRCAERAAGLLGEGSSAGGVCMGGCCVNHDESATRRERDE